MPNASEIRTERHGNAVEKSRTYWIGNDKVAGAWKPSGADKWRVVIHTEQSNFQLCVHDETEVIPEIVNHLR